jgi:hypothetical protein
MKYRDITEADCIRCLNELDHSTREVWHSHDTEGVFYQVNTDLSHTYKVLAVIAAYILDISPYIFRNGRFRWPAITRYPRIIQLTIKLIFTIFKIYKK